LYTPLYHTYRAANKLYDQIRLLARVEENTQWVAKVRWSFSQTDIEQLGKQLSFCNLSLAITLAVANQ
jgi:hypothetical protein